jgi:hypothetical protein
MSHDASPTTTRVPAEFEAEYRDMPGFRRDRMRLETFGLIESGTATEAVLDRLTEEGIGRPFATWYETEVRATRKPVDLYVSSLGSWGASDTEVPESFSTEVEIQALKARKAAGIAGICHLFFALMSGFNSQIGSVGLALAIVALFVALKVYQFKTVLALCAMKQEPAGCFSFMSLIFGWWIIIFLHFKATPRYPKPAV